MGIGTGLAIAGGVVAAAGLGYGAYRMFTRPSPRTTVTNGAGAVYAPGMKSAQLDTSAATGGGGGSLNIGGLKIDQQTVNTVANVTSQALQFGQGLLSMFGGGSGVKAPPAVA